MQRQAAGCGTRIRTQTNRVRVCRATVTQFRKINGRHLLYTAAFHSVNTVRRKIGGLAKKYIRRMRESTGERVPHPLGAGRGTPPGLFSSSFLSRLARLAGAPLSRCDFQIFRLCGDSRDLKGLRTPTVAARRLGRFFPDYSALTLSPPRSCQNSPECRLWAYPCRRCPRSGRTASRPSRTGCAAWCPEAPCCPSRCAPYLLSAL